MFVARPTGVGRRIHRQCLSSGEGSASVGTRTLCVAWSSGTTFPITATLTGKASFEYISSVDGSTVFESGNATFSATVVDTDAKGGAGDAFVIRALDKTGAVLVDIGTTVLGGGKIVAHVK